MKISTKILIVSGVTTLLAISSSFFIISSHTREHAAADAEKMAHLILAQKQAVIKYIADDLRPDLFATLKKAGVDKPEFDPIWMSASYVNRKMTEYLRDQGYRDYYYKNAAIESRHPDNEADSYEREFIKSVEQESTAEKKMIVEIDGESYFFHLRKNDSLFSRQCMQCHGEPENAPARLIELYGDKRSFHKKPGALASVLSVKIPVELAQSKAMNDLLPSFFLFASILVVALAVNWIYVKKTVVTPIEILTAKALKISEDESHLGETVDVEASGEVAILSDAFNFMSLSLKVERDNLDDRIREKTADLMTANEQLKENEETVRLLMNAKAEAIYSIDLDGNCIFCNQSCVELLGYQSQTDLLGENIHALIHSGEGAAAEKSASCSILEAISHKKKISRGDDIFRRADGDYLQVDWWAHPILKKDEVIGAVVTFIDVADLRKQQMKEVRANQLASLGEMAAGVAHEINNPINGIINYTKMLEIHVARDGQGDDLLKRINKEGMRIADIVRKLLTHAHYDTSKVEPLKMQDVVQDSVDLLNKQIEKEGILLDLEMTEDEVRINGNKQQLEQVLINLISNAKHALANRYPDANVDKILRISLTEEVSDERKVARIIVWDQGCGIDEKIISKVTNPFFTTKAAGVGTGLGLSISQDIVCKHGGTLHIESEVGAYTKVVVELPAASV
ncbi:MAG: hypothetical protein C0623_01480 [Desulfuromonas sp.]|nr:MAG: hypothetical protein C0623_01480 [Desulfuromonas sp.]